MIQYKLIQEYPGSPKIGAIEDSCSRIGKSTIFYDSHPEFWQKVEEVDYEILNYRNYNGDIFQYFHNGFAINSVKRLIDGEVFTIGDKYYAPFDRDRTEEIITRLEIAEFKDEIKVFCDDSFGYYLLEYIQKLPKKTPLFTTEDGKDIFEGDEYWFYNGDSMIKFSSAYIKTGGILSGSFSTKEKAEEYILLNKPCLSLNDLLSTWGNAEYPKHTPLFRKFEELAKSKI